jgi:hypothetical protein
LAIGAIHVFRMGYLCIEIQNSVKDVKHIKRSKCDRFMLNKISPTFKITVVVISALIIFAGALYQFLELLVFGIKGDLARIANYYSNYLYWFLSFWTLISVAIIFYFLLLLMTLNRYVSYQLATVRKQLICYFAFMCVSYPLRFVVILVLMLIKNDLICQLTIDFVIKQVLAFIAAQFAILPVLILHH